MRRIAILTCPLAYLKNHVGPRPNFLFSALLPVAAARIFSDDNAVRYQHPVLDDFMFSHIGAYATESAATHAR